MKPLISSMYGALKRQVVKEYQSSPGGFWLFITVAVVLGGTYAYLKQHSGSEPVQTVRALNSAPGATDIRAELEAIDIHAAANLGDYTARAQKMQRLIEHICWLNH